MGDRGNIVILESTGNKIYFYTHWEGSDLTNTVRSALQRGKDRWDDEGYLARILFSELIKDDVLGTTGYGISTYKLDNENPIVYIDMKEQRVKYNGLSASFENFVAGEYHD